MKALMDAFLAHSALERDNTPAWVTWQRHTLERFAAFLPSKAKPQALTPAHLSAFLEACHAAGEGKNTRHHRAVIIRAFARWIIKNGLVSACPLAQATVKQVSLTQHPLPSFAALRDIVEAIQHPDARDAAQLLMLTGARRSEVLKAPWTEFDLEKGLWNLEGGRTKTRRARAVPLTREAVETLKRRRTADPQGQGPFMDAQGQGLHPSSLTHAWIDAARAQKHHGTRLHDLRHAYGTRSLNDLGADIVSIQSVMGHARIETTRRYLHPNPDHAERLKALWDK